MCFHFCFSFIGFSDAPTPLTAHSSWPLRVLRGFTIGNPLGCRGSACVEVMTTLHGSTPSLLRRAKGCIPPEGMIVSARNLLKSTHFLLAPLWLCKMSLDPSTRTLSLYVGASEGFQSLYGHSLDSILPLFGLHLRVLRDWYEFEYGLDHLCYVTLVYVFHSMSLACFFPRAFFLLSWLDTSFHFVVTYSMLWDMFMDHLFTLYTYHGFGTPFFVWSLI